MSSLLNYASEYLRFNNRAMTTPAADIAKISPYSIEFVSSPVLGVEGRAFVVSVVVVFVFVSVGVSGVVGLGSGFTVGLVGVGSSGVIGETIIASYVTVGLSNSSCLAVSLLSIVFKVVTPFVPSYEYLLL